MWISCKVFFQGGDGKSKYGISVSPPSSGDAITFLIFDLSVQNYCIFSILTSMVVAILKISSLMWMDWKRSDWFVSPINPRLAPSRDKYSCPRGGGDKFIPSDDPDAIILAAHVYGGNIFILL